MIRTRDGNRWQSQTRASRSGRVRPAEMLVQFLITYLGRPLHFISRRAVQGFAKLIIPTNRDERIRAPYHPYAKSRAAAQQGTPHEPVYSPVAAQQSKLRWPFISTAFVFLFLFGNSLHIQAQSCDTLRVLSYNIQLLPRPWVRVKQPIRARKIARLLSKSDFDVVVFQEAFTRRQRRRMKRILDEHFPYQAAGKKRRIAQINNGIWIISKYPLTRVFEHRFKNASGIDRIASKGVLCVEVIKNNKRVHIYGTHIQAGWGENDQQNRLTQHQTFLSKIFEYQQPDIPQIITGDFNVSIQSKKAHFKKWLLLNQELICTASNANYWNGSVKENAYQDQIDFVTLRPNHTNASIQNFKQYAPMIMLGDKEVDAADHYGIQADIILPD